MAFDLTPLDFLRLMDLAQRRVWLKGNDINQEGRPYETMHLIVEGGAEVRAPSVSPSLPPYVPPSASLVYICLPVCISAVSRHAGLCRVQGATHNLV